MCQASTSILRSKVLKVEIKVSQNEVITNPKYFLMKKVVKYKVKDTRSWVRCLIMI